MSPNETLFLESTNKIYKDDISSSSFVNFQIWDFPGQVDFFDPTFDYEMIFRGTGALIFVIDAQVKKWKENETLTCYSEKKRVMFQICRLKMLNLAFSRLLCVLTGHVYKTQNLTTFTTIFMYIFNFIKLKLHT